MDLDPRALFSSATKLAERFGDEAYFAALCVRSGMIGLPLPHRSAQMLLALERHGLVGGAISAGAVRFGSRPAIIDELGAVSYKQLDRRSNAIANCWREHGLVPGEGVAILARNHRGFLDAVFAAAKCGARVILLNTSFAGPQIREVAEREGTDLLVYDEEYGRTLEGIEPPRGRWRAWAEEPGEDTLGALIARGSAAAPPKAGMTPRITILTSGTTGSPEGSAPRRAAVAVAAGQPAEQGPVPCPRDNRIVRADVPCPRIRAGAGGHWARVDACRPPPVRSRADAGQPRASPGVGDGGGAGDAPADARARRRTRSPSATCRSCGSSSSAARRSGPSSAGASLRRSGR